ncbi:hypothetical protein SAMN02787142_0473 [Burkholderia sp. WP9]|nr:hypothetical protein SAMN02787142_0473 [Burkholderia sp. WP9]
MANGWMDMASNLSVGTNVVTGQESYFGDVKLKPEQIRLVNASPQFQSQLFDYGSDVSSGNMDPMSRGKDIATYFDGRHIVIGQYQHSTMSDAAVLGHLSHEIGHYENRANDKAFKSQYAVNPRDPQAYNVAALIGAHQEGEAVANNYQIQQEIQKNTASGNAPATQIDVSGLRGVQEKLDALHAVDVGAGKSSAEDRNNLIVAGMNAYVNANPSTATGKSYYQYYGEGSRAPAPETGSIKQVEFTGDEQGDINSMTEHWASGDVGTQTFSRGKIQTAELADAHGELTSTAAYSYAKDGAYSVDVRNGAGRETERAEFNADRSGTVRDYASDNSSQATSFDAKNRNTQIAQFDGKGEKIEANYIVPETGKFAVQDRKSTDGGRTVSNYDAEGRVRAQFQYDRDGQPVLSRDLDENGKDTFLVEYHKDGSRTVATVNADGSETAHIVDRNGMRGKDVTLQPPKEAGAAEA